MTASPINFENGAFESIGVQITEASGIKRASACLRDGVVQIKMPRHWSRDYKQSVVRELAQRVIAKDEKRRQLEQTLTTQADTQTLMTLATEGELQAYVTQLNTETFRAPLKKVRMGQARYSRLAQVNVRTGVMTVSRYSLQEVPAEALRYLIVHELAHFSELGHNRRLWALVGQFVPDYRHQSRVIKAFHQRALEKELKKEMKPNPIKQNALKPNTKSTTTLWEKIQQMHLPGLLDY